MCIRDRVQALPAVACPECLMEPLRELSSLEQIFLVLDDQPCSQRYRACIQPLEELTVFFARRIWLKTHDHTMFVLIMPCTFHAAEAQISLCLSRSQKHLMTKNHGTHGLFYEFRRHIVKKRSKHRSVLPVRMDRCV